MDEITELYIVADDHEADTLDDLRRRAGQTWDHWGCWTNLAEDDTCQRCGISRVDIPEGEVSARVA